MRSVPLAVVVACVGLIGAEQALACTCVAEPTRDALARSDAAVIGKLVDVDPATELTSKFRYRVKRVFKGARGLHRGDTLTLRSARQSSACGLPGRRDKSYGLLLDRRRRRLTASLRSVVSPKRLRHAADGTGVGKICGRA